MFDQNDLFIIHTIASWHYSSVDSVKVLLSMDMDRAIRRKKVDTIRELIRSAYEAGFL